MEEAGETAQRPDGAPVRRKVVRIAGRSVLALVSAAVLTVTAIAWNTLGKLDRESTAEVLAEHPAAPPADDGALDVLLVGSDSRTDAQGNPLPESVLKELRTESTSGLNTDTLIVVRIPHNGSSPTAVSIPRDTYTPVPGGGREKINAVYGMTRAETERELSASGKSPQESRQEAMLAGQRALVQTVEMLTGVRIDHYAEVNLLGFYEITEAVGGVEVCLKQATSDKDSGADFAAGHQTISGGDALAFVRQRHGLPRGDLDRIVRQQAFMAGLAKKVLSTQTLTDPDKLNDLAAAAKRSVVLDQDWDTISFAQQLQQLGSGQVQFVTMPVTSTGERNERGQSIVTVDRREVQRFFAGLTEQQPPRFAPAPVVGLDGSGRQQPPVITSDGEIPCVN